MGQKSKNKGRRIVKVQLSRSTTQTFDAALPALMQRKMLMYDKSKQWKFEGNVTPEIVAVMGDSDKKYFWATKTGPYVNVNTRVACDQNQNW